MLCLFAACLCSSLTACIAIPDGVRSNVSREGAVMTSVMRIGPILLVRTASVIPGVGSPESVPVSRLSCVSQGLMVEVLLHPHVVTEVGDFCRDVVAAARYGAEAVDVADLNLQLAVEIVPQGDSVIRRFRSSTLSGTPRAEYVIPQLSTDRETLENLVGVVSHESVHLFGGIERKPAEIATDERLGHLVGACAILSILGELDVNRLSFADFNDGSKLPASVQRSSRAGVGIARELLPLFRGAGRLQADSTSGERMLGYCQKEIARVRQGGQ